MSYISDGGPVDAVLRERTGFRDGISVLDILILLARHKWLLIGLPLAAGLSAAALSLLMTNVFTASTRLVLPQQNLSAGTAQMLVLGITDIREAGTAYRSLLAAQPGWPVLIVYRPSDIGVRNNPEIAA